MVTKTLFIEAKIPDGMVESISRANLAAEELSKALLDLRQYGKDKEEEEFTG